MSSDERPRKRFKLGSATRESENSLSSLDSPISPPRIQPRSSSGSHVNGEEIGARKNGNDDRDIKAIRRSTGNSYAEPITLDEDDDIKELENSVADIQQPGGGKVQRSPFQLTRIRDLPASQNQDTVALKDLIGGPLVRVLWSFNYLHDIDFLRNALDEDIRSLVEINVVHGFWKREDQSRLILELDRPSIIADAFPQHLRSDPIYYVTYMQAVQYENVKVHAAYMPEMFGTHHTKMMLLLNFDDTAQIIIHTANMISRDWSNMTQGVWRSPLLQKASVIKPSEGPGAKFKQDFLKYLRYYDVKRRMCKDLAAEFETYDFSDIRASLIASVPGRHSVDEAQWGWPALKRILNSVPSSSKPDEDPEVVVQISSIATLGATDVWISKTLFPALQTSSMKAKKPNIKIIFPTPDEIRSSLDGYMSGHSIHTKIQSSQQAKQLSYLKPIFHRWGGDSAQEGSSSNLRDSGRRLAAPHIKTYVRYSNRSKSNIDWALITSANLSKQAWGEACNTSGEVRIASWELGVIVHPQLYGESGVVMKPIFNSDQVDDASQNAELTVGFRMPYDLPLMPYTNTDLPWVATMSHNTPDRNGATWPLQ